MTDISRKDKWQSGTITDGPTRAGARSMLFAAGFNRDALARPIIGVANTWTEIGPCNCGAPHGPSPRPAISPV